MQELAFIKELLTVIGAVTAILTAIGGLALWLIKIFVHGAIKKAEVFNLFKNLVEEVASIKDIINAQFTDNEAKHQKHIEKFQIHDRRITILEVKHDDRKSKKAKS